MLRKIINKVFLWTNFGGNEYYGIIDNDELEIFLKKLNFDKGWKSWYTLRKKAIQKKMAQGISQKEYLKAVGRLQELKQINTVAKTLLDGKKEKKDKDEKDS